MSTDTPPPLPTRPATRPQYTTLTVTIVALLSFAIGTVTGAVAFPRVSALVTSGALGGCDVAAWWAEAAPSVTRFIDQTETASQTARVSLSPIILEMRETQREYEAVTAPPCAAAIDSDVREGMANVSQGFNDFLGRATPGSQFTTAYQAFGRAYTALVDAGLTVDSRVGNIWQNVSDGT